MAEELQQIEAEIRSRVEASLKDHLENYEYSNESAAVVREQVSTQCVNHLTELLGTCKRKYMYAITCMVFEKAGYNRGIKTVMKKSDGAVSTEYKGENAYGIVDIIIAAL